MTISDELMWRWFELLSLREVAGRHRAALRAEVAAGARNPRDLKMELARELAARFHGGAAAEDAIALLARDGARRRDARATCRPRRSRSAPTASASARC